MKKERFTMTQKHGKSIFIGFVSLLAFFFLASLQTLYADNSKIIGTWELELDAGGEFYYLTMIIAEESGVLKGMFSESTGYFSDIPFTKIEFEEDLLILECEAPTPPDGMERLIDSEFIIGEDTLEGTITVDAIGLTAAVTGKREKK
jgi:hypothetical protein